MVHQCCHYASHRHASFALAWTLCPLNQWTNPWNELLGNKESSHLERGRVTNRSSTICLNKYCATNHFTNPQNCDHRIIVSVLPHSKIKGWKRWLLQRCRSLGHKSWCAWWVLPLAPSQSDKRNSRQKNLSLQIDIQPHRRKGRDISATLQFVVPWSHRDATIPLADFWSLVFHFQVCPTL